MRKRFKPEERAAFTIGAVVEWRNGSHWHPGRVIGGLIRDQDGWESIGVKHTGPSTKTVGKGAYIAATPTTIRLPRKENE